MQNFKLVSIIEILITVTITKRQINLESIILACNGPFKETAPENGAWYVLFLQRVSQHKYGWNKHAG